MTQPQDQLIKHSDQTSFMADVIEQSQTVPVIVDFWASWCEPCKQLTPALERAVTAAAGKVKLVLVDVDANKELAGQLQIQTVPTVMGFVGGRPVDGFQGAVSESQIKAFIDKLAKDQPPSPIEQMLEAAKQAMQTGELAGAMQFLGQIVQEDPQNYEAVGLMARCYIQLDHLSEAEQLLSTVGPEGQNHNEITGANAALEMAKQADGVGDIAELQKKAQNEPDNFDAQYDYAIALQTQAEFEQAGDILLAIIAKDSTWQDGKAREQLLKMFEVAGPTSDFTMKTRRKLSSVLFR